MYVYVHLMFSTSATDHQYIIFETKTIENANLCKRNEILLVFVLNIYSFELNLTY